MDIKQSQKQVQKLAMTPQLRQSLHILQLPLLDLRNYVEKEIEENPVIEAEKQVTSHEKITNLEKTQDLDSLAFENTYRDTTRFDNPQNQQEKNDYYTSLLVKPVTLQEMLFKQLRMCKLDEKQKAIGELIIQNIDENGYLNSSLEEIVNSFNETKTAKLQTCGKNEAEQMLEIIQNFDPLGVGARNLKECLLIQLAAKKKKNTLVYKIAQNCLLEVAKNRVRFIAKKFKTTPEKIKEAMKELSVLEPKPGRLYSAAPTATIVESRSEDIIFDKNQNSNKYDLIINSRGIPKLKISAKYAQLIKSKSLPAETKTYLQERMKAALELMKAVQRREETLKKVAQCVVERQKDFFQHGDSTQLKPLTFKEVAAAVSRNESTISRVVNSKYIKTPHGTFKLNYFFLKPLNKNDKDSLSKETVKEEIANIIHEENPRSPLNDEAIAKALNDQGIKVARRTVTKYREQLKIPSSTQRKK